MATVTALAVSGIVAIVVIAITVTTSVAIVAASVTVIVVTAGVVIIAEIVGRNSVGAASTTGAIVGVCASAIVVAGTASYASSIDACYDFALWGNYDLIVGAANADGGEIRDTCFIILLILFTDSAGNGPEAACNSFD